MAEDLFGLTPVDQAEDCDDDNEMQVDRPSDIIDPALTGRARKVSHHILNSHYI